MKLFASRQNNAGIAIGPILFVVALLAILATAIAAGSSTFSAGTDQEKARAYATTILDYSSTVAAAVARVKALGCNDTQISFDNNSDHVHYVNPNAPADKHCHIFDIAGGGIEFKNLPEVLPQNNNWWGQNYIFIEGDEFINTGSTCSDGSCNELSIVTQVTSGVCSEINRMLGISSTVADAFLVSPFSGAYSSSPRLHLQAGQAFCSSYTSNSSQYYFYKVLLVR